MDVFCSCASASFHREVREISLLLNHYSAVFHFYDKNILRERLLKYSKCHDTLRTFHIIHSTHSLCHMLKECLKDSL